MNLFCKHEWEVKDKTILESPYEQLSNGGRTIEMEGVPPATFKKKYICIMTCKKCGKINKTIVRS